MELGVIVGLAVGLFGVLLGVVTAAALVVRLRRERIELIDTQRALVSETLRHRR